MPHQGTRNTDLEPADVAVIPGGDVTVVDPSTGERIGLLGGIDDVVEDLQEQIDEMDIELHRRRSLSGWAPEWGG